MVLPDLEYSAWYWSPHLQKERAEVEGLEIRVTSVVRGLEKVSCEEKGKRLGLCFTEAVNERGHDKSILNDWSREARFGPSLSVFLSELQRTCCTMP